MFEYLHGLISPVIPNCAAISYQSDGALPDEFATYYLVSANPEGYFAGRAHRVKERYSVTCYERDKRNLEPKVAQVKAAMLAGGFLYAATSADRYTPDTEHWARTMDFRYYEENKEG